MHRARYDLQQQIYMNARRLTTGHAHARRDYLLQRHAVVPVAAEVGDVHVGQHGVDPREHQLLRRHLALRHLVLEDELPHHANDQAQVAVDDVLRACVKTTQGNICIKCVESS